MPTLPAAEALFRAHQERATGWLTLLAGGREAKLYLQHGDVVGGRVGFGFQTLAQALLAGGKLDLAALDTLWADGALQDESSGWLASTGIDAPQAAEMQRIASLRRMSQQAAEASFMPALVEVMFARIPGAAAVRAAFSGPPVANGTWVRCRDAEACAPLLVDDAERAFVNSIATARPLETVSAAESVLLRMLEHAGHAEIFSPEGWEAASAHESAEQEERARETSRREAARQAFETARLSDEIRRTEQQARMEQAQRALAAARAAEEAWKLAQQQPLPAAPVEPDPLADTFVREQSEPAESPSRAEALADTLVPQVGDTLEAADEAVFGEPAATAALLEEDAGPRGTDEFARPGALAEAADAPEATELAGPPAVRSLETAAAEAFGAESVEPIEGLGDDEPIIPLSPSDFPGRAEAEPKPSDSLSEGQVLKLTPAPMLLLGPADEIRWNPEPPAGLPSLTAAEAAARAEPQPSSDTGRMGDPRHLELPTLDEPLIPLEPHELTAASTPAPDLAAEMDEALRRAGAPPVSAPARPPPRLGPDANVAEMDEALRRAGAPPVSAPARPPPRLGSDANAAEDADLWRLVEPAPAQRSPLEQAIRDADARLESLAGVESVRPEVPVDAIIQAAFDAGAWTLESLPGPGSPIPGPPPTDLTPSSAATGDFTPGLRTGETGEAARERRQRLLRRAIRSLGTLTPSGTSVVSLPEDAEPPRPPSRTPADERLAREIETRFAALGPDANRFELLGVPPHVTREGVKKAFLELAKTFHPDRLPPALAELAPKARAVFDALREAQDHLLDDARRTALAESLATNERGASGRDQAEAIEAFRLAEAALRRRDYAQADEQFGRSQRLDPRPGTLAARAWAIYMDPARKGDGPRARAMMVEALRLDPGCDRAHYQLGVIARVEGDAERAERHFREAVKANPRHLEAAQELRLMEMRRRGGKPGRKR